MAYDYEILNRAYAAVWDAIDNWPDLQDDNGGSVFQMKYRFDAEDADPSILVDLKPAIGDVPALLIWPGATVPDWYVNTDMAVPLAMTCIIWTPDWNIAEPFRLWTKVMRAIYRGTVASYTVPEVKRVTGLYPYRPGPVAFERTRLGPGEDGPHAVATIFTPIVRVTFNPLATTS